MVTKTRAKVKTKKVVVGRYYIFSSYDTEKEARHAVSVLQKTKELRAFARHNLRTRKWDTLYAGIKRVS